MANPPGGVGLDSFAGEPHKAGVVERYDAEMELAMADAMRQYAADHHAPPGSLVAADFARWSRSLRADGQAHLQAQASPLQFEYPRLRVA